VLTVPVHGLLTAVICFSAVRWTYTAVSTEHVCTVQQETNIYVNMYSRRRMWLKPNETPALSSTLTHRGIRCTDHNVVFSPYRDSRKDICSLTLSCQGKAHLTVCVLTNQALTGGKAYRGSQRSHLCSLTHKSKRLYQTSGLCWVCCQKRPVKAEFLKDRLNGPL